MNVIQVQQGSQEWLDLRKSFFTASEAPAALGKSKYQSRTDLLKQKATGLTEEVGNAKQKLFNRGHQSEADARPFAEMIVKTDLYPVTATLTVDGVNLLASLDGATMMEDEIFEHKLYSEALAVDVRAGTLDPHYTIQMDQQLLVSGAKRCLFMTSDGTDQNMAWCWYESSQAKFDALTAGWKQFAQDLAAYVPQDVTVAAVAAPQMNLPAVSIQVTGSIALVDNLEKFGTALTAYIGRINKTPETDQDFADLEATVKTLKTAEEALDAAETNALAQTDSIDAMRRTVALYRETAKTNRLLVEKIVKAEKENRRTKILSDAVAALHAHMKGLQERTRNYMPTVPNQFQDVIKGLKSLDSMKDKLAGELARCKIEANAIADRISFNLALLDDNTEFGFLFPDAGQMVLKAADDFTALVNSRIAAHKAEAARKEEETRARIQAEEQAKAEKAAREKLAAEQADIAKAERDRIANEAAKVERIVNAPDIAPAPALTHTQVVQQMPATVRQAMAPKPAAAPTMSLGTISERLGFNCTSAFLATLGFEATTVRAAKLYHAEDFNAIGKAIIEHIESVCELQAA